MRSLPPGWEWLPLERVLETLPSGAKVQQGWSPQCEKEPAGPEEWGVLKTTAIQAGAFSDEHHKRLPAHLSPRPGIEVRSGDLLLTNAGPRARCGIPCLVRATRPRLLLSGKVYRFRADESLMDPRLLEYFLLDAETQLAIDQMKTGISDSGLNLTQSRFAALPVVVPPLTYQRRIVEILEDHLSRLDFAAAGLDRCQVALPVMRLAFLKGERNRLLAEGVDVRRIGDTCQTSLGKMLDAKRARGLPTPYLRNINVRWGRIDLTDVLNVPLTENERARLSLVPGDLLVCEGGEPGRCAVWWGGADASIMTFQKALHRIRVHGSSSDLRPTYVAAMLEELVRSGRADLIFTGTTIKHLPQEKLRMLEIPVPPVQEQDRILESLDSLSASAERLSANVRTSVTRAHQLQRSLLSAAFSGRLTSRTGHDEVAEELAGV